MSKVVCMPRFPRARTEEDSEVLMDAFFGVVKVLHELYASYDERKQTGENRQMYLLKRNNTG